MFRRIFVFVILVPFLFGCEKKIPSPPEVVPESAAITEEPIQKLAREAAQKIYLALKSKDSNTIEISSLENHAIFPDEAFSYFQNSLIAQLGATGIQKYPGDWKLKGGLSKQRGEVVFSFHILKGDERAHSESARIPDDTRLQNTLKQFGTKEEAHDHTVHKEMPVPTPLAKLNRIPLDVTQNCLPEKDCNLLLLYSNELVERNWTNGTERTIPLPVTSLRSRAPSGKILTIQDQIFVLNNQMTLPLVLDRNLNQIQSNLPSRFPRPEPGLNTYTLSDGRFFEFEEFGPKGLAVVDFKNRLSVADQGKLISSDHPAGGTIFVSHPYIYASSTSLSGNNDSILKFLYKDGLLVLEKSQNIEGSVYDIAITDLNRDQQQEMLLTVRNSRGIFIEVYEPF